MFFACYLTPLAAVSRHNAADEWGKCRQGKLRETSRLKSAMPHNATYNLQHFATNLTSGHNAKKKKIKKKVEQ